MVTRLLGNECENVLKKPLTFGRPSTKSEEKQKSTKARKTVEKLFVLNTFTEEILDGKLHFLCS